MGCGVIALLVGEVGSGKTTVCWRLARAARRGGLRVAGILSRPRRDAQGQRSELVAVDLWSGEWRRLASLRCRLSDLCCGPHSFDPAAFAWAVQAVQRALAQAPDLVILDEIGPLELEGGAGLAPLLACLPGAGCPALLVVRRACRQVLEERLAVRPLVFEVSAAGRDDLPRAILDALTNEATPTLAAGERRLGQAVQLAG